jgi:alkylation response protein AidB-like acyl-CoA dehydrogenase
MTAAPIPGSLVIELAAGRVMWEQLHAFPRQAPDEAAAGAAAVDRTERALDAILDPERVERERELPRTFFDEAHRAGLLRVQVDQSDGGLGLSDYNTFRVISTVMQRSPAAGYALGVHNGIGLPALLAAAPQRTLRELIIARLAQGAVSGWADTEPQGAANMTPATVAEPHTDGGFRLTGEKVFIGNGTIADELIVSATVPALGRSSAPDVRLFLVDTSSPGFHVHSSQEVIGLKGAPLGALRLDRVVVPAERIITGTGAHWRDVGPLEPISSRGRTYLVSGAALAIARRCISFQQDFVRRRTIDGKGLKEYPAIRHLMARSTADLYALDTVVRWGLIGDDALIRRHRDRYVSKNITTRACWRIVERTMSLLAAEGAETADSKRRRNAPPLPVEQLLRDARVLRIAGGVDFLLDLRASQALIASATPRRTDSGAIDPEPERPCDVRLTPTNSEHLDATIEQSGRLARTVSSLTESQTDRPIAAAAVGRIASELLSMTLTLARAADAPPDTVDREQHLAEIHCSEASNRLAGLWRDIEMEEAGTGADGRATGDEWLDETS